MRLWISVLPAFVPSLTSHLKQLISASLDMDAVLHEIAQAAATRTDDPSVGPPQVSFVIADEATRTLEACAFSDNTLGVGFPTKRLIFDQGGAGWVATHRQPLSVPHTFNDEHFVVRDWWRAHGFMPSPDAHDVLAISAEAVLLIFQVLYARWSRRIGIRRHTEDPGVAGTPEGGGATSGTPNR